MATTRAYLKRADYSDKQVLGTLELYDGDNKLFECKTLELAWKDNQHQVSCIPKGTYKAVKRNSAKFHDHFHVLELDGSEVNGRDMILIHQGNYNTDIKGCILVGRAHSDINKDGYLDVIDSKNTLSSLNQIAPQEFELNITGDH